MNLLAEKEGFEPPDPFESAVFKTALPRVDEDEHGRDAIDRIVNEHTWLSRLSGRNVPAVKAFGSHCMGMALAIEDIEGMPFSDLPKGMQITLLPDIAELVQSFHEAGIAHRDIKPENIICSEQGLYLIDFELACQVDDLNPFKGGTRGFFEPNSSQLSWQRDVHALGSCLFLSVLGMHPATLEVPKRLALLRAWGLTDVAGLLERAWTGQLSAKGFSEVCSQINQWVPRAPFRGPKWLRTGAAKQAVMVPGYMTSSPWHLPDGDLELEASFYDGAAGRLLALASIDDALAQHRADASIRAGADWLAHVAAANETPGLFLGQAGIALALSVTGHRYGEHRWIEQANQRFEAALAMEMHHSDFFHGRAGLVWTGCMLDVMSGTTF